MGAAAGDDDDLFSIWKDEEKAAGDASDDGALSVQGHWQCKQGGHRGRFQLKEHRSKTKGWLQLYAQHPVASLPVVPRGKRVWGALSASKSTSNAADLAEDDFVYLLEATGKDSLLLKQGGGGGSSSTSLEFVRLPGNGEPKYGAGGQGGEIFEVQGGELAIARLSENGEAKDPPADAQLRLQDRRSASPQLKSGGTAAEKKPRKESRSSSEGSRADAARLALINEVKEGQRASTGYNTRWREFCEKAGGGIFDPTKHQAKFLEDFLAREQHRGDSGNQDDHDRGRHGGEERSRHATGRSRGADRERGARRTRRHRSRKKTRRRRGEHRSTRRRRRDEGGAKERAREKEKVRRPRPSSKKKTRKASARSLTPRVRKESAQPPARSAPPPPPAELIAAQASAEAARSLAEKALTEQKEQAAVDKRKRLLAEKERQGTEISRRVEEAEAQARLEEDEEVRKAVKLARENREAKVAEAKRSAEEEAQRCLDALEDRLQDEAHDRLRAAEEAVREARSKADDAASALEAATSAPSARERSDGGNRANAHTGAGSSRKESLEEQSADESSDSDSSESSYSGESEPESTPGGGRRQSGTRGRQQSSSASRSRERGRHGHRRDVEDFLRVNGLAGTAAEDALLDLPESMQAKVMGTDGGRHRLRDGSLKLPDSVRNPVALVLSRIRTPRQPSPHQSGQSSRGRH